MVVISAEQDSVNGPGCCAPEQLEALADALVEAKGVAIPGEEVAWPSNMLGRPCS